MALWGPKSPNLQTPKSDSQFRIWVFADLGILEFGDLVIWGFGDLGAVVPRYLGP